MCVQYCCDVTRRRPSCGRAEEERQRSVLSRAELSGTERQRSAAVTAGGRAKTTLSRGTGWRFQPQTLPSLAILQVSTRATRAVGRITGAVEHCTSALRLMLQLCRVHSAAWDVASRVCLPAMLRMHSVVKGKVHTPCLTGFFCACFVSQCFATLAADARATDFAYTGSAQLFTYITMNQ